jgi:glycerol uptake facilitator-like aquaporin
MRLARRIVTECIGTALLLAATVSSGVMAQDLADDDAVALLANTLATAAALAALILTFGPISGAHLNSRRNPGANGAKGAVARGAGESSVP